MAKLKYNVRYFLSILLCLICLSPSLYAANTKVHDFAGLLSHAEIEALEGIIATIGATYQMDVGIVTTNDTEGKSVVAYSDDFYDYNDYGYGSDHSGLLLLISMQDRDVYISATGKGEDYFNDARIDKMIEAVTGDLSDGNYSNAFTIFLNAVQGYMDTGLPSSPYDSQIKIPKGPLTLSDILSIIGISTLIALAVSSIVCLIIRQSYKHPRHHAPRTAPDRSSVDYTSTKDQFLRTHTSRIKIQSNNGGGSSTHTSSSGRSHGGGGGKF